VSTTVSLEQTHAFPHNQYSGNFLGALQASQRHFPHSRQMMESDWSLRIAEFKGNVGNVEVGLGKGASNVLIKLNRPLLLCSDKREELWLGHKRCPLVPGCWNLQHFRHKSEPKTGEILLSSSIKSTFFLSVELFESTVDGDDWSRELLVGCCWITELCNLDDSA